MKILALPALTLTALSVFAGPVTDAMAQSLRAPKPPTARERNIPRTDRRGAPLLPLTPADEELCIRDELTGRGIRTVIVRPEVAAALQASFPKRFALTCKEGCGNGVDDDCDGQIDEDCTPPGTPVCGNGVVEAGEGCDDGNDLPNDGCYECSIELPGPPLPTGLWFAGPDCDACMSAQCATEANECLSDSNCDLPRTCMGEANCMNTTTGVLGCICGNDLSLSQCLLKTDNFEGDCADAILGVGATIPPGGSGPLGPLRPVTPGYKATQAYRCMARACRSECAENFYTP